MIITGNNVNFLEHFGT